MEIIKVMQAIDGLETRLFKAANITVGTRLAEPEDGFLWDVTELIDTCDTHITVRLNSDFSSFRQHWTGASGFVATFRKTDLVYGIQ